MEETDKRRPSRWVRLSLGVGSALLLLAGLLVGFLLREVLLGVLLSALGTILFALRGYLEGGEKVLAGVLVFEALVAIGIEAVIYLLGS